MGSNGKTPLDDWRFDGSGRFKIAKADPAAKPCTTGTKAGDIARLAELSVRLDTLQDILYAEHHRKLLVVLQGMDTSGKDGTVRGVFRAFDPLGLRVAGFKAPTPQELARDFLWRVHAQVPARGEIVIFNRSHYEDVLITRVHGDIDAAECKRRYEHIRAFERMLEETGTTIVKCFLHLSRDEQRAPAGAHRRSAQALEIRSRRHRRAPILGRLHGGLRRRHQRHRDARGALACRAGGFQVAPQPDGGGDHAARPGADEAGVSGGESGF